MKQILEEKKSDQVTFHDLDQSSNIAKVVVLWSLTQLEYHM